MSSKTRKANRLTRALKELWALGLDFALPWKCVLCDTENDGYQEPSSRGDYCETCSDRLADSVGHPDMSCQRCGAVLGPYSSTKSGCVHCRGKKLMFDSVTCLGMYDKALREALLSAKYSTSMVGLRALCGLLVRQRLDALTARQPDIVIPIPHHWRARLSRHFNSAAIVGHALSSALKVPHNESTLKRSRLTRPQKRIALNSRFENQKDAFRVYNADLLQGKHVLLVDDVLTTGATCSEAAANLKRCGAASCHVAVIARVLDSSVQ